MLIKNIFGLFTYVLVWVVQLFFVDFERGRVYFLRKFTNLSVISMNFAIIFFGICVFRMKFPRKVSGKFQDALYVITFSLTMFADSIHWYVASMDYDLISLERIQIGTKEYYCSLFLYGGNLLVLIWYGLNIDSFSKVNYKATVVFVLVFFIWYSGILFAVWLVTGGFPYEFISKFSKEEYLALALCVICTNAISVFAMIKFIKFQLHIKKGKKD